MIRAIPKRLAVRLGCALAQEKPLSYRKSFDREASQDCRHSRCGEQLLSEQDGQEGGDKKNRRACEEEASAYDEVDQSVHAGILPSTQLDSDILPRCDPVFGGVTFLL
jgi:hypothetical protein